MGGMFNQADSARFLDLLLGILQNTDETAKNTDPVTADRLDGQDVFTLSQINTITIQQANEFIATSRAILSEHQKTNRFLEDIKGGSILSIGTMQTFTNLVTVQASQAEVRINNANVNILGDGGATKNKLSALENDQYISVSRA